MILEYIEKAIEKDFYEKIEDGTYSGEIPECLGILAFGKTLYECQRESKSTLEDWIAIGLRHGHELPVIEDLDLNNKKEFVHE